VNELLLQLIAKLDALTENGSVVEPISDEEIDELLVEV
jgi:hypothetical protein